MKNTFDHISLDVLRRGNNNTDKSAVNMKRFFQARLRHSRAKSDEMTADMCQTMIRHLAAREDQK